MYFFNEFEQDNDMTDEGPSLKRTLTPEILESRERDTDETLEGYRENLENRGVGAEAIDGFIQEAREGINLEYKSLDEGVEYPEMYKGPVDWGDLAQRLLDEEATDSYQLKSDEEDWSKIADEASQDIDYEDIDMSLAEVVPLDETDLE